MTGWLLVLTGAWLSVAASARYRLRRDPWRLRVPRRRRNPVSTDTVVELIGALRDELDAGTSLRPAFERAVHSTGRPVTPQALAVCRMGGDVPPALRADAGGEQLLISLAALWQVSEGSGGAMAAALDRLMAGAVESARLRREIAGQLAAPRATARVLAFLPVIGVGLGFALGADPFAFLLGTPWGWLCLAVAAALETAGVLWMRALVRRIERRL
jgi:tight adherence protein B